MRSTPGRMHSQLPPKVLLPPPWASGRPKQGPGTASWSPSPPPFLRHLPLHLSTPSFICSSLPFLVPAQQAALSSSPLPLYSPCTGDRIFLHLPRTLGLLCQSQSPGPHHCPHTEAGAQAPSAAALGPVDAHRWANIVPSGPSLPHCAPWPFNVPSWASPQGETPGSIVCSAGCHRAGAGPANGTRVPDTASKASLLCWSHDLSASVGSEVPGGVGILWSCSGPSEGFN